MSTTQMETKLPHLVTPLPGPQAQKILKLDDTYISPSYTRSYPLVARRGSGAMIEDTDGNIFLDFAGGIAVVSTGHCHPEVVAAIQKQAAELIHISGTDFYYENMIELAEKLFAIAPIPGPKRIFYANSGTEAIECAFKLARYHSRRDKVIAFYGSFHGRTMGSLSLTASKAVQRKGFGPLVPGVFHIPYPNLYRRPASVSVEDYIAECVAVLERDLFKRIVAPEEIAAIFVEPIQGEGGYVPAPKEFLLELQRICRQHKIMLVSDEVQSGIGRTGKWWGGDHSSLEPDIVCIAKGIASGMPLGVCISRAEIMNWTPGAHASTFGGNPVCIAAALATIDLIEKKYLDNARRMGEYIFAKMADWTKRHRIVGDVRGKGLMVGVEIVRNQQSKERAGDLRDRIVGMAFSKGLLILGAGENSFRLSPPLIVDEEQVDFAVHTLDECISEIERSL